MVVFLIDWSLFEAVDFVGLVDFVGGTSSVL